MVSEIVEAVLMGFWLTIPAYLANPSAVLFGGGTPMDFGKKMKSGERVLGDGKTWRGFFGGAFAGFIIGLMLVGVSWPFSDDHFGFGAFPEFIIILLLLSFGALTGDVMGSFIKRRTGKERGAKAPGLDQYDFLIGAWLLLVIFRTGWFLEHFISWPGTAALITVIILTPFLHRGVNILGYRMGKKDVPW